jgi:hypothetical protein
VSALFIQGGDDGVLPEFSRHISVEQLIDIVVGYAQFFVFMGVSLSITAFLVLARILAEVKYFHH